MPGKTTYLEVVSLSEEEGLRGAKIAVEAGFDILMGTVFFDSILNYLKGKPIQYYPFPGHIYGHPSIMDGTIEDIVAHAKFLESKGVQGMDLLSYRYIGDALACCVRWSKQPMFQSYLQVRLNPTSVWLKSGRQGLGDLRSAAHCSIKNLCRMDPSWTIHLQYVTGLKKLIRTQLDQYLG